MPNVRNGAVRKVSGLLNLVHLSVKIVSNKLTLRVGFEGEFGDKLNHIHRKNVEIMLFINVMSCTYSAVPSTQ